MKQMKRSTRCWKLLDLFLNRLFTWSPDPFNFVHSLVDSPMLHPYQTWGQDVHPRGFFDFLQPSGKETQETPSIHVYTYLYSISTYEYPNPHMSTMSTHMYSTSMVVDSVSGSHRNTQTTKHRGKKFSTFSSAILCHQGLDLFHGFFLLLLWSWSNS